VRTVVGSMAQAPTEGKPVTVLPGRLAWVPGLKRGRESTMALPHPIKSWHQLRMMDYADNIYLRGGEFGVPHYGTAACGKAYGPLALDQILSFCLVLQRALEKHSAVVVATEAEDVQERANVSVLVGAYLILKCSWSAEQVADKLSVEAKMAFPCCWYKRKPMGDVLLVSDCWAGLQLARSSNWIDAAHVGQEPYTSMTCSQYRRTILQYDIAWLVPGEVCVGADPITVIHDPKPTTCKQLVPPKNQLAEVAVRKADMMSGMTPKIPGQLSSHSLALLSASSKKREHSLFADDDPPSTTASGMPLIHDHDIELETRSQTSEASTVAGAPADLHARVNGQFGGMVGDHSDGSSCHTVCKDYNADQSMWNGEDLGVAPDFVTWCKSNAVALVVRMNLNDEPGVEELGGSYHPRVLEEHGLAHFHYGIEDHDGATPMPDCIRQVINACEMHRDEGAAMFHCKGGFGRSVMLACCYIIYRHNVPGKALLGWIRMARPGAITTPQQERFLYRMRGKADLAKYMKEDVACCTIA